MNINGLKESIYMSCYICFEPTKEKSPCTCTANVHELCLKSWRYQHPRNMKHCTICRSEYTNYPIYLYLLRISSFSSIFTMLIMFSRWVLKAPLLVDNVLSVLLFLHIILRWYISRIENSLLTETYEARNRRLTNIRRRRIH